MHIAETADPEAQIRRYTAYLDADTDNIPQLLALCDMHHRAGHLPEAEEHFRRVLELDAGHAVARGRLANVQISRHQFHDAEASLRALDDEELENPVLQYNLGLSLYYQEKWTDALAGFRAAAAAGIDSPEALNYLAHCEHRMGNIAEALALATESWRQAPDSQIESYVALLHMDNGDFETADRLARNVLATDPDNVDANVVAGTAALQAQEIEQALRFLSVSLEGEPDNPRAWLGIGLVRMYEQDLPGAIDAFKQALDYTPRNAGIWVTLGWAYIGHGDLEQSEQAFRHATELDRSFGEAHGGLAVVYALAKRGDEAREEIKRARGLNKAGFGAVFAQTILLEARGQRDRAVRLLGEAFKRSPTPGSMRLIEAIEIHALRQSGKQGPTRLLEKK
jgi:tetratricopeptide (TPR) repeat protein